MKDVETSFLGTGWSFPPTFSKMTSSVVMVSDDLDIRQSLWVLFSTSLGERIMLPEYGSLLWKMVFQNVTTTLMTQLEDAIRQAVLYWEARIDIVEIQIQADATQAGLVYIYLDYVIRQTNSRSNLVYPFYLNEATIPVEMP